MKIMKHWFFISLALILSIIIGYRWLGWFLDLEVVEQEIGVYTHTPFTWDALEAHAMELEQQGVVAFTVIYAPFTWGMSRFHPTVEVLEKAIAGKGIRDIGKLVIYHDLYTDKRSEASEDDAGIIINPEDIDKLDADSTDYKIMTIPAGKYMVISFPYKGSLSCMIGHIRWTKAMHAYLKSQHDEYAPVIELYDKRDAIIYYVSKLSK